MSTAKKSMMPSHRIHLTNGLMELVTRLPHAPSCDGVRFDLAGHVSQATCRGHTWFGEWNPAPSPVTNGVGTAGEFGMGEDDLPPPLGYEEAKMGESFLKIGVGFLRKVREPHYYFGHPYELLQKIPWKVGHGRSWIEFHQDVSAFNGYGYSYAQRIELNAKETSFAVQYRLDNTGIKPIHQGHYSHNFIMLDHQPVGPDYRLTFSFVPTSKDDLGNLARLQGRELIFARPLNEREQLFARFEGFPLSSRSNGVIVRNGKTKTGIHISGNSLISRYNLFATSRTVCPEPFVEIHIQPGETISWENRHELLLE